jgi:hypothetical protein
MDELMEKQHPRADRLVLWAEGIAKMDALIVKSG